MGKKTKIWEKINNGKKHREKVNTGKKKQKNELARRQKMEK